MIGVMTSSSPPSQEQSIAISQLAYGQDQPANESRKWSLKVSRQGPWNEAEDPWPTKGAASLPMPVEIADKHSLAPFFTHLQSGGTHLPLDSLQSDAQLGQEPYYAVDMIEYPKGVLYSDGRVDLCKMVVGPTSIQDLMDSLRPNLFARHFLLGNNIIGAVGAKAIASFVDDLPERFETWYLAGNCINAASVSLLVNSWIKSPAITNIWLKRNPLYGAAHDLARLIASSPHLRTLDLDQTELGDDGVAELFAALLASKTTTAEPFALRHIYLNATGISEHACQQISLFLASPKCNLESLYMACNPIGSSVTHFAAGVKKNQSLQRLSLPSCGLQSQPLSFLIEALCGHPSLRTLDLGQAYATEDLGARYNWITDLSKPLLVHLLQTTKLQSLDLNVTALTQPALNDLNATVARSPSMLLFQAKSLLPTNYHPKSIKGNEQSLIEKDCRARLQANVLDAYGCDYDRFLQGHKRFVISPLDVRLIDSVYRNRDAGLARRGLKVLDKHWNDGDDTALRAELGTL